MSVRRARMTVFVVVALVVVTTSQLSRPARAISTGQIVSSAASPGCMDYQVIGVCVWLTCTPFGCETDTSVRVKHFMPDLVVPTYHRTGENPWSAVASYAPPNALSQQGGNGAERRAGRDHTNLRFKNADAIGHPAAAGFDLLASAGYSCESLATPFEPYYLSVYDPLAWRAGIPESAYPEAVNPFARVIGTTGNVWGHVYPRSGFVTQANDYKAAAVIAQRVADFVTREGQPHVYTPLTGEYDESKQGYWPPGPVVEGDDTTHKWQRLQPNLTEACEIFPDHSVIASYAEDLAPDGDYVWTLWRPYKCCEQRGAALIFYTPDPTD